MSINSYPTVFALGHRAIEHIFDSDVLVEEKIDGSQFSFGLLDGIKYARSKKQQLYPDEPESGGMFARALEVVRALDLHEGWIYRGEFLGKPAHNALKYGRIPNQHIILYDIQTSPDAFLSYDAKADEADRIGLEVVPLIYQGKVHGISMFNELLERDSILGDVKIEGVVVKNYNIWTMEKKIAIGKYVSEAYKEIHKLSWAAQGNSIIDLMISEYKTEARWRKAVEHLRDEGKLEGSPRDIGALIQELSTDTHTELADEIARRLFKKFWPQIQRGVQAGFAEWYKARLLVSAFEEVTDES